MPLQILFEIVSQTGYRTHFALFPCGIVQEYRSDTPFVGGGGVLVDAPPLRMLSKGQRLRKGGGGVAPPLVMLRHQTPHSAQ